jgi:hypothetical protein
VDNESTDVKVSQIAHQILDGHIRYVLHTEKGEFSRGSGLHIAANLAKERGHDSLFFCDADMYFTKRYIFDQANEALKNNKIYYPIFFSFTQPDHMIGFWRDTSYGMMFCKTETYFSDSVKPWQHNVCWGEEDILMFQNFTSDQVIRKKGLGFYHQWHPNSIVFKNLEYPVKHYAGKPVKENH